MRSLSLSRLAVAGTLMLAAAAAQAQASFMGWQLAGGWPVAQMTANADWTSDLGPDFRYDARSTDGSTVNWSGEGRQWASRPYGAHESGLKLGWEGTARGGAVGQTFSGGALDIGPVTSLEGGGVARIQIHLWSELGDNAAGLGISTDSRHNGYASVLLGPQAGELHWRLDWNSRTQGDADLGAYLYFSGVFSQAIGGTSGTAQGVWAYGSASDNRVSYPDLQFTSFAGDSAGDPRTGRIDTWLTVSLSSQPIAAPVPEPGTWALWTLGLAGMGVVARRTRARRYDAGHASQRPT